MIEGLTLPSSYSSIIQHCYC